MKMAIAATLAFVLASGAAHAQLNGEDLNPSGLRLGWPTAQCESISLDVGRKNESVSCKLCCKKPLDVSPVRCEPIDSLEVHQLFEQRQKRIKEGTLHNLVALGEIKQSLESRLRNARLFRNLTLGKLSGSSYLSVFFKVVDPAVYTQLVAFRIITDAKTGGFSKVIVWSKGILSVHNDLQGTTKLRDRAWRDRVSIPVKHIHGNASKLLDLFVAEYLNANPQCRLRR